MANLVRKALKIFAGSAINTGVFGSAADSTKVHSTDPDVIQSKAAWDEGWDPAVIGARKFPALEEMQAVQYVVTYMLAYLFQKGIPEYEATTQYYQYSIVRRPGTYELYGSLTDNNVGNALDDTAQWDFLQDLAETVLPATTVRDGIVRLAQESNVVSGSSSTSVATAALLASHGFVTGDIKWTTRSQLQPGWIWASGDIGNASSGATNRANADCLSLFTAYWEDAEYTYTGTTAPNGALQVFNSAGVPVAKGISAAADWAANCRIAVPDIAGRVVAGRNGMVVNAGRLSGQPGGVNGNKLGATGGLETHSLTAVQNGPHFHEVTLYAGVNSSGQRINSSLGGGQSGAQTSSSGEGSPHNNVQPTIIENALIKL